METIELISGYDRKKNPQKSKYRYMNLAEVLALTYGEHIWFVSIQGTARQAKVNGNVKRWKREPEKFELPLKYGMYECCRFTNADLSKLIVPIEDYPVNYAPHTKECNEVNDRSATEVCICKNVR